MTPEGKIQADIEAALGAEPDLILMRNTCGHVKYYDEKTGDVRHVTYGLAPGSPDIVGILSILVDDPYERADVDTITVGVWFCLEVKAPGEKADPKQEKIHKLWSQFGAFVRVVHSVEEATVALNDARHYGS